MMTVISVIISSSSSKIHILRRSPIEYLHINYLYSIYYKTSYNELKVDLSRGRKLSCGGGEKHRHEL